MTQAVIYTRFSPRRNAAESESCETQEAQCREHANSRGWTVRSCHADKGVSGTEVHREGLEAALAALRRGDVLLVYRRDRVARDLFLSELLRRRVLAKGARIAAIQGDAAGDDEGPEAVFVRQVLDAVAELERKLIGARTKAAMLTRQRAGQRMGRYAPYGKRISTEDPTRLEDDPAEQAAVTRARELVREGLSPYQAAKRLDEEMPGACRGKSWSARTVQKIAAR